MRVASLGGMGGEDGEVAMVMAIAIAVGGCTDLI
jgi:hypothetical protein